MTLPYPTDPAGISYPNPFFQDNAFVRGDQARSNNQFIWANLANLDSRAHSPLGNITGGLIFNSVSLPPTILAGFYDIDREAIIFSSNQTMAVTDTLQQSKQTLDNYCQYVVCLQKSTGNKMFLIYGEGAGNTGTITSITGGGTTKTLTVASGSTSASDVGKVLYINGNNGVNGTFLITGRTPSTYTFESVSVVTGGASGTWTVYDRINTMHGTGSQTSITTDAEVIKYSPSYGENGWASSFVVWDNALLHWRLDIPGYTDWIVLGNFRTDGSAQVQTNIVSHKTGRNKNDNYFWVTETGGFGSGNTEILYHNTVTKLFGCDYVMVLGDTTNGDSVTTKRPATINTVLLATLQHVELGISLNSTHLTQEVNTLAQSYPDEVPALDITGASNTPHQAVLPDFDTVPGDVFRPHANNGTVITPSTGKWIGSLAV